MVHGLQCCVSYIDGAVIYNDTWVVHLVNIREFLEWPAAAEMTVYFTESDFTHACIKYLGHVVKQDQVRPRYAKVKCILGNVVTTTKKELMRIIGMAGYYRKFCQNVADNVSP